MMTMYSVGMKKMGPYYMAGQKMNNTIIEYINGMEVVKVFNKDADSYERFRKDVSDYRDYTLAWYKAAWPWMAIYSSLLPCTVILTLPLGAWFVLSGWSALPDLILVLCLSLSIGMPLLKSLGFLPTMPQLNYKISALEQVLDAPELQQTPDGFHGKDDTIVYDHVSFGYTKTQPGPDGKPMVVEDEVLHDISFTAKAGQKTALVGESGSGKSTLARLLVGLEPPDQGTISLDGEDTSGWSTEDWRKRRTKLQAVFQDASGTLNPMRSVRSNVEEAMVNLTSLSKRQRRERIGELMELTHMEERLLEVPARQLSGGEQRRLSLVRAMSIRPKYLVLDEVLSGLDLISADAVMRVLEQYHQEFDCAFLLITHDMDSAYRLSDTILTMQAGQIVRVGIKQ